MYDLFEKIKPLFINALLLLLFIWFCLVSLFACTISVTTLHTQGTASDVVDENQAASPQVDAKAEIPSIIPKI